MLYRKQYLLGFLFFALNFVVALLAPGSLFPLVIWLVLKFVVAINAKSIYVDKAVNNIRKARAQQVLVREWEAHLQLIGGVSHLGALLAIAITAADTIVQIIIINGSA